MYEFTVKAKASPAPEYIVPLLAFIISLPVFRLLTNSVKSIPFVLSDKATNKTFPIIIKKETNKTINIIKLILIVLVLFRFMSITP